MTEFKARRRRAGAARAAPAVTRRRSPWRWLFACGLCGLWLPAEAAADAVVEPWEGFGDHLAEIYGADHLIFPIAAAALTPPLVFLADRPVQDAFQQHNPLGSTFGPAMLWVGGLGPVLVPVGLYATGRQLRDDRLASAGAAVLQAEVIQLGVVALLKWVTDRAGPFPEGDPAARRWHAEVLRDSRDPTRFDWNPLGVRWGLRWPSGHTAANMTAVSTLVAYYPNERWLPWVGYGHVAMVALGMIDGDYHWLSDVVAGALIGHVIGWVVGTRFRREQQRRAGGGPAVERATAMPLLQVSGAL